jgi:hypothetical protein
MRRRQCTVARCTYVDNLAQNDGRASKLLDCLTSRINTAWTWVFNDDSRGGDDGQEDNVRPRKFTSVEEKPQPLANLSNRCVETLQEGRGRHQESARGPHREGD